jgi:hypothetical protein
MSKYSLYDYPEREAADAAIDEFIATLDQDALESEPDSLEERCVEFAAARGIDLARLGFYDTESRHDFWWEIERRDDEAPLTAAAAAGLLVNGEFSAAREAIVLNRTPSEVVVFALDVVLALDSASESSAQFRYGDLIAAIERVRLCVNGR